MRKEFWETFSCIFWSIIWNNIKCWEKYYSFREILFRQCYCRIWYRDVIEVLIVCVHNSLHIFLHVLLHASLHVSLNIECNKQSFEKCSRIFVYLSIDRLKLYQILRKTLLDSKNLVSIILLQNSISKCCWSFNRACVFFNACFIACFIIKI